MKNVCEQVGVLFERLKVTACKFS